MATVLLDFSVRLRLGSKVQIEMSDSPTYQHDNEQLTQRFCSSADTRQIVARMLQALPSAYTLCRGG